MSDSLFAHEAAVVAKASRNIHTIFWLPMQYYAFVWAGLALLSIGSVLVGSSS